MIGRPLATMLWRQRWTAVIVGAVVFLGAVAWAAIAPRQYTATAVVTATPSRAQSGVDALEATFATLVDSRPVLMDVRELVGKRRTAAQLQHEVTGHRIRGTVMIQISVEDGNRGYARDVANAIADILPRYDPTGGAFRFTDVQRATTPSTYSSPDTAAVLWWGAGLAVLLALAAAFGVEAAVGTVSAPRQLADLVGAPVLAALPRPTDAGAPASSEQFRSLRVALEFASSTEPTTAVVMAPMASDPAAAWVTINLAGALAQVQRRVLVIEADFGSRPRHPAFNGRGPGLAEVLRGTADVRRVVRPSDLPGVSVLSRGGSGDDCAADLIELHFHRLLAELADEIDVVLVHAPPVTESDDARVMAAGNALVLTVAARRVRTRALRQALAELRQLHLRVLGTVLVASARRRP